MLVALFPILTTLTLILMHARAPEVVHVIATFVMQMVPAGTEELILSRLKQQGAATSLPVLAMIVSLWAGSGAMLSLMEGFKAAYRIPSGRGFIKDRSMAIFLVFIAALPAVGASSLIIMGDHGVTSFIRWMGASRAGEVSARVQMLGRIGRYGFGFFGTTLVTGLLYYFGPNYVPEPSSLKGDRPSRFLRVWPGAIVATVLWLPGTAGFAWYVAHIANYNFFYGSLGTVIVLLVWLYLTACITLIGCEYNAERDRLEAMPSLY